MASKTKYDPLEAAKLGTDQPPASDPSPFTTPAGMPPEATFDVSDAMPPPIRRPRYTLLKDKRASVRGQLIDFKAGRIFDSAGYDIGNLTGQGLELELIKE